MGRFLIHGIFRPTVCAAIDPGLTTSKTPEGTTLLMMAANDAEKVKLLIDCSAKVRAKAKTGFTALMVATTYLGTSKSTKLRLAHGAEARPGLKRKIREGGQQAVPALPTPFAGRRSPSVGELDWSLQTRDLVRTVGDRSRARVLILRFKLFRWIPSTRAAFE